MEKPAVARDETHDISFVLRLWRERDGAGPWRASLQNVDTGQRTGFACLDQLFEYLRREITRGDASAEAEIQSACG